jgi:hypothetical protein
MAIVLRCENFLKLTVHEGRMEGLLHGPPSTEANGATMEVLPLNHLRNQTLSFRRSDFLRRNVLQQDKVKIPFPIFVVSLPKSGTTSMARYFYCGEVWTAHTFANTDDGRQLRIGECYQENVMQGRPPFAGCGNYHVWSDNGFIRGKRCYYPSIHGLKSFYEHYPNATILLVKREKEAWRQSMRHWKKGALLRKWWKACSRDFPLKNANDSQVETFYEKHADRIRRFVRDRPSLTYIEIQLENNDVAEELEGKIGISKTCWGHHNSHEKRMRQNPRFRKDWNGSLTTTVNASERSSRSTVK